MPDVVNLLKKDHRLVEQLFQRYTTEMSSGIAEQICAELTVHLAVEEEIVYPVLRRDVEQGSGLEQEAEKEHQEAKDLIAQIERVKFEGVGELMKQLRESVQHHVSEEENEVLPKMQAEIAADRLEELGAKVEQAKQRRQTAGRTSTASVEGGELAEMTRDELYDMAKEKDISGRSDMNKDQLIEALEKE